MQCNVPLLVDYSVIGFSLPIMVMGPTKEERPNVRRIQLHSFVARMMTMEGGVDGCLEFEEQSHW